MSREALLVSPAFDPFDEFHGQDEGANEGEPEGLDIEQDAVVGVGTVYHATDRDAERVG